MEQSLNFEMLRSQWPELAELACMAERYVHSDPKAVWSSCVTTPN